MKRIYITVLLIIVLGCKTGTISEQLKKGNAMFEKLNISNWEELNKKYKGKGSSEWHYYLKDGSEINTSNDEMYILPAKPYFYVEYKSFYDNDFIKVKGKYFGRFDVSSKSIKIGTWYEFDEKGSLIKQTDEDTKFGKFGYNEVLQFLHHEKQINIHTGSNRENIEISFYYSPTEQAKLWNVIIKIGKPMEFPGSSSNPEQYSSRIEQKVKVYNIDGNTGEVIERKDIIKYKSILSSNDYKFPELKQ